MALALAIILATAVIDIAAAGAALVDRQPNTAFALVSGGSTTTSRITSSSSRSSNRDRLLLPKVVAMNKKASWLSSRTAIDEEESTASGSSTCSTCISSSSDNVAATGLEEVAMDLPLVAADSYVETSSSAAAAAAASNSTDATLIATVMNATTTSSSISSDGDKNSGEKVLSTLPSSPQLTFEKYVTMQGKRVPVEIRYSSQSGLRPFFLTVAKRIKTSYPDVVVTKRILSSAASSDAGGGGGTSFEVLVDGRVVIGKAGAKRPNVRPPSTTTSSSGGVGGVGDHMADVAGGLSVYVDMEEIDQAIAKARRKRRPNTTVYSSSQTETEEIQRAIRLEVLRKQGLGGGRVGVDGGRSGAQKHWND